MIKDDELSLPVDDRFLIKRVGKGGTDEKELVAFARDVDRHALKKVD